ncbi:MAG: hypothetical protein ABIY70_00065 [Capsulimonas sp.]|uniref:hypothetical protein n=1 Tax=Capsulimonas sp. TaxID=2494211 RepID=UPI00326334DB
MSKIKSGLILIAVAIGMNLIGRGLALGLGTITVDSPSWLNPFFGMAYTVFLMVWMLASLVIGLFGAFRLVAGLLVRRQRAKQGVAAPVPAGAWPPPPRQTIVPNQESEMRQVDEARSYWQSGQAMEAGRILYDQLPVKKRPLWAVGILEACLPLIPPVAEFEHVRTLAHDPNRWREAHDAFSAVRALTLQNDKQPDSSELYGWMLVLTENTAKVIYNGSEEQAPFDYDAGWAVVACARGVVDAANQHDLEEEVWEAAVTMPR